MEFTFDDELECLKACYSADELIYWNCSDSRILKFTLKDAACITFKISEAYPHIPPQISLAASDLLNAEKSTIEEEIRNYAAKIVGSPMIMDLVIKLQQILEEKKMKENLKCKTLMPRTQEFFFVVILIDHMRNKNKYSKLLTSWVSELDLHGALIFCQRWIFLILQNSKKNIKEFITRLRTVPIDVDSSGKPCKEKMCKILYEGTGYNR
ncbi:RWD domain-containing protein 3-like [Stegodyphus dumicola]|uniref:RWD domain-containing protein 3-like n=1 Tax=Stegodyphus dumicola TaxID=202533 RepID=UPI0015AB6E60|nr:RWD domain-containing protein 3-like [Stegodyphus dumicola]